MTTTETHTSSLLGRAFMAGDATNGAPLWQFPTNQTWRASPMTYMFDNKQYVAVAAGQGIVAFGLPE